MSLSIRWTRWLRLFSWRHQPLRRNPRRVAAEDFADCGTAFGLDLSMSAQPARTEPAERGAVATSAPARR